MKTNYFNLKKLTLALSLMTTVVASAQNFTTLGNGTTGNFSTGYPAPYGNFYGGSRHNLFVTAAELSAAGVTSGAQITSIGFNITGLNGASPHQGWNMKVYTTTLTDPLVSAFYSGTPVSTSIPATITGTIGWNQTSFTPFIWNGTDNLVIETCFNNMSYTYNYSTMWTTTLTGTSIKARYNNEDNMTTVCSDPYGYLYSYGYSSSTRPDMRFEWFTPTPCAGTPPANTIIAPSYSICPNTGVTIGFATGYTLGGLTYAWQSSTVSAVGPFNAVPNGTTTMLSTPNLTTNTWFTAVVTCTNSSNSTTATAGLVQVQPITINTVPYSEGFEGILNPNELPNCSWKASNLPTTCQTYTAPNTQSRSPHTGSKFAAFYYTPAGTSYFYSNGIQLNAGVTYSAGLWYQTEYYGYNNWDLALLYNTSQIATGASTIVSTNGPAISNVHKLLSNTFTVPTSGIYYLIVRGNTTTGSYAYYLSWDDLFVTIPCNAAGGTNTPTLSLSAASTVICQTSQVNITATGADTYTWNTGTNGNLLTDVPNSAMNYTYEVAGTNTLSGCSSTVSQVITVNPSPFVFVAADKSTICSGSSANLTAMGTAVSYTWSNSNTTNIVKVSPTVPTTYTVVGENSYGCTSEATVNINVTQLPNVTVQSSMPNDMCVNETVNLTGGGAVNYQWLSSTSPIVYQGSPISVSPNSTTTFTLIGTDANGCSKSATILQTVKDCVGLNTIAASSNVMSVFPNPTNGELVVNTHTNAFKSVEIVDVSGRVLTSTSSADETVKMNMSSFANGVYYVKVQTGTSTEVIKVVKN